VSKQNTHITPDAFRKMMVALGFVMQKEMAAALRVSEATISCWLSGETGIPARTALAIEGLRAQQDRLSAVARKSS
jgi:DNA-binding transcriptional regulator YdaS (Cro superfamily)